MLCILNISKPHSLNRYGGCCHAEAGVWCVQSREPQGGSLVKNEPCCCILDHLKAFAGVKARQVSVCGSGQDLYLRWPLDFQQIPSSCWMDGLAMRTTSSALEKQVIWFGWTGGLSPLGKDSFLPWNLEGSSREQELHSHPFLHCGSVRPFSFHLFWATGCYFSAPVWQYVPSVCLHVWAWTSIHNPVGAALRRSESCDVSIQRWEGGGVAERINVSRVSHHTQTFWWLVNELVRSNQTETVFKPLQTTGTFVFTPTYLP